MTPGHVSPLSNTLIPPVNTAVLAAAAGTRPGLGLARNAGIVSRNGGSAAGGAGDRRVRCGPFSLDEVPTGDASGDTDATRGAVLEDGAGVAENGPLQAIPCSDLESVRSVTQNGAGVAGSEAREAVFRFVRGLFGFNLGCDWIVLGL